MKNLFLIMGATASLLAIGCSKSSHKDDDLTGVYKTSDIANIAEVEDSAEDSSDINKSTDSEVANANTDLSNSFIYIKSLTEIQTVYFDGVTNKVVEVISQKFTKGNYLAGGVFEMKAVCSNTSFGIQEQKAIPGKLSNEIKKHKLAGDIAKKVIDGANAYLAGCSQNSSGSSDDSGLESIDPSSLLQDGEIGSELPLPSEAE